MDFIWIILIVIGAMIVLALLTALICFFRVFYAYRKRKPTPPTPPPGKIYKPYHDAMKAWMQETLSLPHDDIEITSFDGLTLHGKYYESIPGAPIEIMMHGYRSTAERDLCGGVQRCFTLGHNALVVDQRACGRSEGHVITFGINESRDCLAWAQYLTERFGEDVKIILTGISMGASSVLIATSLPLPKTVVGVLADCGFTSARDIIQKVIKDMKLPPRLLYPFVRLGAKLYGHFDPDETAAIEALKSCSIPILLIHGETDDFVPCEMSIRNYKICAAPKRLLTVPGAGHGLSYLVDRAAYTNTLAEFCTLCGIPCLKQPTHFIE